METPKVVITIEGGLVSSVSSNTPMEFLIIDYDVEGMDEKDLTLIPQGHNESELGYIYGGLNESVDKKEVNELFKTIN